MSAKGEMPKPIKISQSRLGWSEAEINSWLYSVAKMEDQNEA